MIAHSAIILGNQSECTCLTIYTPVAWITYDELTMMFIMMMMMIMVMIMITMIKKRCW